MHRFWKHIIKPILVKIKPTCIVEIGAAEGLNTVNIVNLCKKFGARCHVIDPLVPARLSSIEADFKEVGTFHQDLSIHALKGLKGDCFLIDGDHNWYTVFNELKAIFNENVDAHPTIFFHDVCFPYARRDLYYNPSNVPAEFVLPYKTDSGIDLVTDKLIKGYGLNLGLANAIQLGGPKNGVLTAIEDFIVELSLSESYTYFELPLLHGLGLLIHKDRLLGLAGDLIQSIFRTPTNLLELTKVIERERLKVMQAYCDYVVVTQKTPQ